MKKMISLVLALAMSLVLCVPAFADEGELAVDLAADVEIAYNEEAEQLERLESDITPRDNKPPEKEHDLSKTSYEISGTFDSSIYTLCYFKTDANGKISYSVDLEFIDEVEEQYLPTLTIELWDRSTKEQVATDTFKSKKNVWPFLPIIRSGDRAISGLNPNHEYYFVCKRKMEMFCICVFLRTVEFRSSNRK